MGLFEYPSAEMGSEAEVVGRRIVAFGVDLLLVAVCIAAVVAFVEVLGPPHRPSLQQAFGVVFALGYFVFLEGTCGQTVGKRLLDVVVVTEDGERINYAKAAGRTFLRFVDGLFFVGLFAMLATERHQRPGDVSAETLVLRAVDPTESSDD